MGDDHREPGPPDEATRRLLTALLRIPAAEAARIRERTRPRTRPRRQVGPTADYGWVDRDRRPD
jgi:hypothetical protein